MNFYAEETLRPGSVCTVEDMMFETIDSIPVWVLALAAFGVQFWLFCLLPHWINANSDELRAEAYIRDDDEAALTPRQRLHHHFELLFERLRRVEREALARRQLVRRLVAPHLRLVDLPASL